MAARARAGTHDRPPQHEGRQLFCLPWLRPGQAPARWQLSTLFQSWWTQGGRSRRGGACAGARLPLLPLAVLQLLRRQEAVAVRGVAGAGAAAAPRVPARHGRQLRAHAAVAAAVAAARGPRRAAVAAPRAVPARVLPGAGAVPAAGGAALLLRPREAVLHEAHTWRWHTSIYPFRQVPPDSTPGCPIEHWAALHQAGLSDPPPTVWHTGPSIVEQALPQAARAPQKQLQGL